MAKTGHNLLRGLRPLGAGEVEEGGGEGGEVGKNIILLHRHEIAEDIQQDHSYL